MKKCSRTDRAVAATLFLGTPVDEVDAVGDVGDSRKLFTDSPGHPIDTKVEVRREVQDKERHFQEWFVLCDVSNSMCS